MKQITVAEAIQRTVEHREVFHDEMLHIMRQIMRGELTPAQIAGFIVGLRVKKETIGEIAAAAQVMREFATPVKVADLSHLVDTCGTGGDAAHTFNVSTASAFVAAITASRVRRQYPAAQPGTCSEMRRQATRRCQTHTVIARAPERRKTAAWPGKKTTIAVHRC